jgi:hypothetical protein
MTETQRAAMQAAEDAFRRESDYYAMIGKETKARASMALAGQMAAALAEPEPADSSASLVAYILQDDIHNRLTPRIVDIAYSAFMIAKQGKNKDDGGPCDWFNDTKPMVMEQLAKIKRDLAKESRPQRRGPLTGSQQANIWIEVNRTTVTSRDAVRKIILLVEAAHGIGAKP